jgi:putative MATE family efflux protein
MSSASDDPLTTPPPTLLDGRLDVVLLRLAGPMLLSAILQNAQSLIDLFWVGRLGQDAVAALALAGTALMLLFPLLMGLATGTVALVSRAYGAGRHKEAAYLAAQSLTVAVATGLLLGFACLPLVPRACAWLGAAPSVAPLAITYLRVSLMGLFSGCLLFVAGSALQGAGNTVMPMVSMLTANILNLALDPLFIFGWGPVPAGGVAGAAWATVLSQVLAGILVVGVLASGRVRLHLHAADLWPRLSPTVRLLRVGIPSSLQMLARSLMGAVVFKIVAACGTAAMAGFGIGMRIHMVLLMPCFVLGNAAATLVGQNLGAGQAARARRAAWVAGGMTSLLMLVSAGGMAVLAGPAVRAFNTAPDVVAVGASYLRWVTPFYVFAGLAIVMGRALNGAGCTIATMIFTLAALWGLQVPLAALLTRYTQPPTLGIWWAIAIATVVHAVLTVGWFETGRWQRQKV